MPQVAEIGRKWSAIFGRSRQDLGRTPIAIRNKANRMGFGVDSSERLQREEHEAWPL